MLPPTASTTMTFPSTSATIARTDAAQTFTGVQAFTSAISVLGGTGGTPGLTSSTGATTGIAFESDRFRFYCSGTQSMNVQAARIELISGVALEWNFDLFLNRAAAADLQLGADVNGAAVSQTIRACNGITGSDKTGGNLTLASGKGTGAGAVSSLIFQTPTVLASGTTAQSLATRLTVDSAAAAFTVPVTHGAQYSQFTEMTAPAAGAADTVRIYAVDNGSGKTQLMALFSSGAAQQLAVQPYR